MPARDGEYRLINNRLQDPRQPHQGACRGLSAEKGALDPAPEAPVPAGNDLRGRIGHESVVCLDPRGGCAQKCALALRGCVAQLVACANARSNASTTVSAGCA